MSENPRIPRDLAQSVRWALYERVSDAEPSRSVWQGIEERIQEQCEPRPAPRPLWERLHMRPALQVVAVGVAIIGLGAGVALSSHSRGAPSEHERSSAGRTVHTSKQPLDALSGRVLWLASQEPATFDYLRMGGYLE